MENPELPLHQTNPELFKTYLLDNSSQGEILMVKGVTLEDHLLKSEIHIKVIIKFQAEACVKFKGSSPVRVLANLRRRIRNFMRSEGMEMMIRKVNMTLPGNGPALYELDPHLFEQFVLDDFTVRPRHEHMKGITQKDRMLKIEVALFILDDEIIRLSARVKNQSVQAVRSEHVRNVNRVLAAYGRLLPADNNN
ncbi:hypothetical protein [Chitinophaga sp. HK235]|uniref:hypothetical protein n=1 Tax=Chitinophaga sp. HK235 TaxID=2952571 RepID=UPI001BAD2610|nr:hypothetical protein [Chitinophaga sp. HK235]